MAKSGIYSRILGQGGSKAFTLDDCLQVHRSLGILGGPETEHIIASQVFRGVFFDSGKSLGFNEINVQMDWLAYWVVRSGIKETMQFQGSGRRGF